MRTYIQTIVIILVTALFFSCESDPIFEDFETANDTLSIDYIEEVDENITNRSQETNVDDEDIPESDKVDDEDIPESGRVDDEDIPETRKVDDEDIPDLDKKVDDEDIPDDN